MFLQIYAVIILGIYFFGIVDFLEKGRKLQAVSAGVNVLIWSPFVGRALGWW